MKVVFVDIDGVLNHVGTRPQDPAGLVSWLERECVARLNRLVRETGAAVVVSSSWRTSVSKADIAEAFRIAGASFDVLDVTPTLERRDRQAEIAAWLQARGADAKDVVVLDDERGFGALEPRTVWVSPLHGLTDEHVARAIAALHG